MRRLPAVAIALAFASGCAASKPAVAKAPTHGVGPKARTPSSTPFLTDEDPDHDAVATSHDYFNQDTQPRTKKEGSAIDLSALPIADLPEPTQVTGSNASWPIEIPDSTPTPDGIELRPRNDPAYVDYGSPYTPNVIHFSNFVVADAKLGASQWPGGAVNGDPLIQCGPKSGSQASYYGYRVEPAHFEGIERNGNDLRYLVLDGWIDAQTCKLRIDHKSSAPVGEIFPGLLYGFRSCAHVAPVVQGTAVATVTDPYADSKVPCTDPNRLNLFFPRTTAIASSASTTPIQTTTIVTRATLPIRQGTSESLTAAIPLDQMTAWAGALGLTMDTSNLNGHIIELDVEVQQGSDQEAPIAVAYFGSSDNDPKTVRFKPRRAAAKFLKTSSAF